MALQIGNSTIGYDVNGMQSLINEILQSAIPNTIKTLNNKKNNVRSTIDTVWVGASAEAFKDKLDYDNEVMVSTFNEIGEAISANLNNAGSNVEEIDAEIAKMFGSGDYDVSSTATSFSDLSHAYSKAKSNVDKKQEIKSNIVEGVTSAISTINNVYQRTGCTIADATLGLVEGIAEFGEAIVDTAAILVTGIASIGTGTYDLITGSNTTEKMWESTMSFVATKHVKSAFDEFYSDTAIGNYIATNAYAHDTVRSVSSGIGYTVGVVALTVVTCGAAGVAVSGGTLAATAAVAGFGKGTEAAWADGASLGEGLAYGAATGAWEGAQFYVGGEIAGFNALSSTGTNIAARIAMDSADGAVEGFVQPALQSIYKDESYSELFNEAGGWKNVGTQAAIGAIMSSAGEAKGLVGAAIAKDTSSAAAATSLEGVKNILSNDTIKSENVESTGLASKVKSIIDENSNDIEVKTENANSEGLTSDVKNSISENSNGSSIKSENIESASSTSEAKSNITENSNESSVKTENTNSEPEYLVYNKETRAKALEDKISSDVKATLKATDASKVSNKELLEAANTNKDTMSYLLQNNKRGYALATAVDENGEYLIKTSNLVKSDIPSDVLYSKSFRDRFEDVTATQLQTYAKDMTENCRSNPLAVQEVVNKISDSKVQTAFDHITKTKDYYKKTEDVDIDDNFFQLTTDKETIKDFTVTRAFGDTEKNVRLNLAEMKRYNDQVHLVDSSNFDTYEKILNSNNLTTDEQMNLYKNIDSQNISAKFYEDMNKLTTDRNQKIVDSLVKKSDVESKYSAELSTKHGVKVYDMRDSEYNMLVRNDQMKTGEVTRGSQCTTLISNKNTTTFGGDNPVLVGYDNIDASQITSVSVTDAYSNPSDVNSVRGDSDAVNQLLEPVQIVQGDSSYSEINSMNKRNESNTAYIKQKPDYILAKDEITPDHEKAAKFYGVGIRLVKSQSLAATDNLHIGDNYKVAENYDYM